MATRAAGQQRDASVGEESSVAGTRPGLPAKVAQKRKITKKLTGQAQLAEEDNARGSREEETVRPDEVVIPQYERLLMIVEEHLKRGDDSNGAEAKVLSGMLNRAWEGAICANDEMRLSVQYVAAATALEKRQMPVEVAQAASSKPFGGLNLADLRGTDNLPSFSGDFAAFDSFMKSFFVEVDSKGFDEAEKLARLKKCVKAEPAMLLEQYDVTTPGDYKRAMEKLKEVYTCKYATFRAHVDKIMELEATHGTEGCKEDMIKCVGLLGNSFGKLIKAIPKEDLFELFILRKFEEFWAGTATMEEWKKTITPGCLPNWKDAEKFALDRARDWSRDSIQRKRKPDPITPRWNQTPNAIAEKKTRFACHFCAGDHKLHRCQKFLIMGTQKRKEAARARGKCEECFGIREHNGEQCTSYCWECRAGHHRLLCPKAQ